VPVPAFTRVRVVGKCDKARPDLPIGCAPMSLRRRGELIKVELPPVPAFPEWKCGSALLWRVIPTELVPPHQAAYVCEHEIEID
jgi:hypothetical protein